MQAENLKVELTLPPDRGGETVVVYVKELSMIEQRDLLRAEELNENDPITGDPERAEDDLWNRVLTVNELVSIHQLCQMTTATAEQLLKFTERELVPLLDKARKANPNFFRVKALKVAARQRAIDMASFALAPASSAPFPS